MKRLYKPRVAVSTLMDTNLFPWPCLSHIPATRRLYVQRELEATSQKVTRKSVVGVCCWYLLQDNFREEEILVLKNNWQPNAYCFFLVLVFLPFCLHLYCLFPFFYLLFAFQLRDLSSISPKLSPAPVPACLGPPAQSLQSLSQSVSVLLAAQL